MKKFMALALAALMVMVVFVGCGKKEDPVSSTGGSSVAPSGTASTGEESSLDKIKKSGKIVMATSPDFAPSEFIDPSKSGQDQYVGIDIEVGKYIADKLGVELVIEAMEFKACQAAVTTGAVDMAISGFAWKEDRAESMNLSKPYNITKTENPQGLLILKEDADKYKTLEDFAGKTIAAQNASLQADLATEQLPKDIKLESFAKINEAILMLKTKKVDAIAMATESGEAYAKNNADIQMCDAYFVYDSGGTVICMKKGDDELTEAINEIIDEIVANGLYDVWKEEAKALAASLGIDTDE